MWKKLFLILGGILCLGLVVAAMYVGLTIGLSVYIAQMNHRQIAAAAAATEKAETQQMQQAMANTEILNPEAAEKKQEDAELSGQLPTLFVDPEGYGVEDNWLASMISREIAEMAFPFLNPDAPAPSIKAKGVVDASRLTVHVTLDGFAANSVTSDVAPSFAWDPDGYSVLARQLLSTAKVTPPVAVNGGPDVLTDLLDSTGPKLAAADVRLSAELQAHPGSATAHESAALLLAAVAMRVAGGTYPDIRPLLNRATAHLALAEALRGDAPEGWTGLVADAAVRALAGRAVDALTHLDALAARPDIPPSAKPWMAALKVLATRDWREADLKADSPLMLKIVWMKYGGGDLPTDLVKSRLKKIIPAPSVDSNGNPDKPAVNPQELLPDWGHILGRSPFYFAANDDVKNATYDLDLEFHELGEVLDAEGARPLDLDRLADVFSVPVEDTVSPDSQGQSTVHVIGVGEFTALARGRIFDRLLTKVPVPYPAQDPYQQPYSSPSQDPAEAQNLAAKNDELFRSVPGYDWARLHLGFVEDAEMKQQYADWESAAKTWRIWEVPYALAQGMPGYALVKKFYARAVPFGTAFEADARMTFIREMDPWQMPAFDTPELRAIQKLPLNQSIPARAAYNDRYDAQLRKLEPKTPQPFEQQLLKLNPYDYPLATDHIPQDKLLPAATRFLDYNVHPLNYILELDAAHLADSDRLTLLRKRAVLDPEFGFTAAVILRGKGLIDEAAALDRKAFEAGQEDHPIAVSDSVMGLVDYDLNHGLKDEAMKVAQFAGEVNSDAGLGTECLALEAAGRLDEAESVAQHASEMYGDTVWLNVLHIRHQERWPKFYADALQAAYPDGVVHAKLADFSGEPKAGQQIAGDNDLIRAGGLAQGDVIVALDGYRIESVSQYDFVRALSRNSIMDFIVWRKDRYLEIAAIIPGRRLFVDFSDFPAH